MQTSQNKYTSINYELNDIIRKKTKDISKYNKPNNINSRSNKKRYVSLKEKDSETKKIVIHIKIQKLTIIKP